MLRLSPRSKEDQDGFALNTMDGIKALKMKAHRLFIAIESSHGGSSDGPLRCRSSMSSKMRKDSEVLLPEIAVQELGDKRCLRSNKWVKAAV